MKKKLLLLLLVISGFVVSVYSQNTYQALEGDFDRKGEFDKWNEWTKGKYSNGTIVEYRGMLSASKKGCKVTVEVKNLSEDKIKMLVSFSYNIPKITIPMTGFEKISIKPSEIVSTSYTSSFCGGKSNDYNACYSCGHSFEIVLKP